MPINNPNGGTQWPIEQCDELAKLLATGIPYREIALVLNEKFGTSHTKNAIVGKVQRLNLTPPDKPKRPPYVRKPKIKRSPRPRFLQISPRAISKPRSTYQITRIVSANSFGGLRVSNSTAVEMHSLRCVEVVSRDISLFDLGPNDCRYPNGDGAENDAFTFCGHPKQEGSSYCTPHFHLCRQESRPLTDRRYSSAAA